MTTITIEDNLELKKTKFINLDDLLDYLLSLGKSQMKYENLSKEETKMLDNLKSMKDFKNTVKGLKI